jgi:hypothetical protein
MSSQLRLCLTGVSLEQAQFYCYVESDDCGLVKSWGFRLVLPGEEAFLLLEDQRPDSDAEGSMCFLP